MSEYINQCLTAQDRASLGAIFGLLFWLLLLTRRNTQRAGISARLKGKR